jgi:hypothetical protein
MTSPAAIWLISVSGSSTIRRVPVSPPAIDAAAAGSVVPGV